MKCKGCGGELPEGSKYCGFCQVDQAEVLLAPPEKTSGWQVDDCGSCGNAGCGGKGDAGLTAAGKDVKYALFIVSLAVLTIGCTLFVKLFI